MCPVPVSWHTEINTNSQTVSMLSHCWCAMFITRRSTLSLLLWYVVQLLPSVLWQCWLGVKKSTRVVKIEWWGVGVVICLQRGAVCLHMVQPMPLYLKTPPSLASFKSRLVLPFWYRLNQVVLEKRTSNRSSILRQFLLLDRFTISSTRNLEERHHTAQQQEMYAYNDIKRQRTTDS